MIPIFFVSAGFIWKEDSTFRVYISKKAKRLLIPYFFYGLSLVLIMWIANNGLSLQMNDLFFRIKGLLYSRFCFYPLGTDKNCFFLNSLNSPLWFLTAMFFTSISLRLLNNILGGKLKIKHGSNYET